MAYKVPNTVNSSINEIHNYNANLVSNYEY